MNRGDSIMVLRVVERVLRLPLVHAPVVSIDVIFPINDTAKIITYFLERDSVDLWFVLPLTWVLIQIQLRYSVCKSTETPLG